MVKKFSFRMVCSNGSERSKTEPFKIRTVKRSVFEWVRFSSVRNSSPHCICSNHITSEQFCLFRSTFTHFRMAMVGLPGSWWIWSWCDTGSLPYFSFPGLELCTPPPWMLPAITKRPMFLFGSRRAHLLERWICYWGKGENDIKRLKKFAKFR